MPHQLSRVNFKPYGVISNFGAPSFSAEKFMGARGISRTKHYWHIQGESV